MITSSLKHAQVILQNSMEYDGGDNTSSAYSGPLDRRGACDNWKQYHRCLICSAICICNFFVPVAPSTPSGLNMAETLVQTLLVLHHKPLDNLLFLWNPLDRPMVVLHREPWVMLSYYSLQVRLLRCQSPHSFSIPMHLELQEKRRTRRMDSQSQKWDKSSSLKFQMTRWASLAHSGPDFVWFHVKMRILKLLLEWVTLVRACVETIKECEGLSQVRKQFAQIENQQPSLLNLHPKFLGDS